MSKVAVVYWSGTGNTQSMADAVIAGITGKGGEAVLLTATEFDSGMIDSFDAIAFGCPSMGSEQLEESEFEPMFESCESKLSGKKIALFGSYGWGDGEWMRNWEERCVGDGAPDELHEAGNAAITAEGGWGIPFIKPWEGEELERKMCRAAATGTRVLGMDIDAAGLIALARMGRPVSPKTCAELAAIVDRSHELGMKFVLKGIMTVEDAIAAERAGCDGIVVSNHGGRALDHTPGTIEVLPAIAAQVKGRMAVLMDGGIRDGLDVLKALAFGADAVLIGRPFCLAAVGGGSEGVKLTADHLYNQLVRSMVLTGCPSVREAGRHLVSTAPLA